MKGATTEWSKMGGLTYDFTRSKLYVAMNEVREGMEDSANEGEPDPSYDIGGPNDIRVAWNECGCGVPPHIVHQLFGFYRAVKGRSKCTNSLAPTKPTKATRCQRLARLQHT